jgi:hypothetical protein
VQLNHPHLAGLTIKEKCKQTARKPNKGRLKKGFRRPFNTNMKNALFQNKALGGRTMFDFNVG